MADTDAIENGVGDEDYEALRVRKFLNEAIAIPIWSCCIYILAQLLAAEFMKY